MNKTLPVSLFILTAVSSSFAAQFKLPEDKPTCTVTIPDDWKPAAYSDPVDGVSGQTEDGGVYISVECVDTKSIADVMDMGSKWFKSNGVKIDDSTLKTDDKYIVNGMNGSLFSWTGKDKDGPCIIQMAVLPTQGDKGDKGVLVDYWASPDADKQYSDTIKAIIQSITPTAPAAADTAMETAKSEDAPADKGDAAAAPAKEDSSKKGLDAAIAVDKDTKPTDTFSSSVPQLYAFWISHGLEKGDKVRGAWIADDVGAAAPKGTKIDETTMDFAGDNENAFSLSKPTAGWPIGKYHVEIYINDTLAKSVPFSIVAPQ